MNIKNKLINRKDEFIVDPEPLSIYLGIVGASGAVVSIVNYSHYLVDKHKEKKDKINKAKLIHWLSKLENTISELEGVFRIYKTFLLEVGVLSERNNPPFSQLPP